MDLIQKLEKRFGFRELPETAQVQFNNARQTPDELLEILLPSCIPARIFGVSSGGTPRPVPATR
jgi:hypothetical protein